jgi:hypothetical protein
MEMRNSTLGDFRSSNMVLVEPNWHLVIRAVSEGLMGRIMST